jgi:hypothetical protein
MRALCVVSAALMIVIGLVLNLAQISDAGAQAQSSPTRLAQNAPTGVHPNCKGQPVIGPGCCMYGVHPTCKGQNQIGPGCCLPRPGMAR